MVTCGVMWVRCVSEVLLDELRARSTAAEHERDTAKVQRATHRHLSIFLSFSLSTYVRMYVSYMCDTYIIIYVYTIYGICIIYIYIPYILYTYIILHVYVCIYVYTHTHTHTHIHTHTHTHTHIHQAAAALLEEQVAARVKTVSDLSERLSLSSLTAAAAEKGAAGAEGRSLQLQFRASRAEHVRIIYIYI